MHWSLLTSNNNTLVSSVIFCVTIPDTMLLVLPSSYISAVGADPLIITVARDGIDELVCLEGKIACNTFTFAHLVDGNCSDNIIDVTMVITYPQVLLYEETMTIGIDIRNLKLVGGRPRMATH